MNRRHFLGAAAGAASAQAQSPNDRIEVAIVGPGGRGTALLKEAIEFSGKYNARVTAVCDIWNQRRDAAAKLVRESHGVEPKAYRRLDDVLADKSIDAVIIATPDHQHAKMLKAVVESGKDAYCEKPMGNVLEEANAAFEAVQRTGRIVQLGTQRRSYPKYRSARKMIADGRLGDFVRVDVLWNVYSPFRWTRKPEVLREVKETDTDWKEFLYGKPYRPFDPKIYRSFRLFREFSSGIIDQHMTHGIDVVHFLTGELYPMTAVADGGLFHYKDYRENQDNLQAVFKYGFGGKPFLCTFASNLANGAGHATRVLGTLGTADVEEGWRISGDGVDHPNKIKAEQPIPDDPTAMHHMANWLDSVRRRDAKSLYAPAEAGYGHSIACIMATDALWSGRRMTFDPKARTIQGA